MGAASSSKKHANTTNATTNTDAFVKLLGDTLVSKNGNHAPTAEVLSGKSVVALYFSAHWCPPCRGFTPVLADAYVKHLQAQGVEIVFVSLDQNDAAFKSYFKTMPWLAVPYAARNVKKALGEKYRVTGIPSLILLNGSDGSLLSADGRAKVSGDPTGQKWLPKAASSNAPVKPAAAAAVPSAALASGGGLAAVLGTEPLLSSDGASLVSLADVVKAGTPLVGLYFSAHWCGPCRAFTPQLVTFVEMLAEEGVDFPIIFGSSDSDAQGFADYFATMGGFSAFPFGDTRVERLKKQYEVSGLPWLVVLDATTGKLVLNEADTDVPQGSQAYDRWRKMAKQVAAAPAA